ncbi:MAG: hypothetical protein ACJ72N_20690 [Labedaea sp.]
MAGIVNFHRGFDPVTGTLQPVLTSTGVENRPPGALTGYLACALNPR